MDRDSFNNDWIFFGGKMILVTGAAGFIGSHLCERLVKEGKEVVGIDCFSPYYSFKLKELNAKTLETKGVKIFNLDLTKDELDNVVKDVEVVFHLAAQPGISSKVSFEDYLNNNFVATQKLLEAVREKVKLFVYISTSSVYGKNAIGSEHSEVKPTSIYGVTKLAAEQLIMANYRDKNFPACSLRIFSVYGPRERPEKLYMKLIKTMFDDKAFPLYDQSQYHLRSYTYVGDIVEGFIQVLKNKDKCIGEIINLGIEESNSTGEGIKIVEEIIGKKAKLEIKPSRQGDQLKTKANIEKAKNLLRYTPQTTLKQGLKKTVKWYEENIHEKIIY